LHKPPGWWGGGGGAVGDNRRPRLFLTPRRRWPRGPGLPAVWLGGRRGRGGAAGLRSGRVFLFQVVQVRPVHEPLFLRGFGEQPVQVGEEPPPALPRRPPP